MKNGIKTLAIWLVIIIASVGILSGLLNSSDRKMNYSELIQEINQKEISEIEISADKTPKLTLDFTDNNNGFSLKAGNTYIISTKYWYEENGNLNPLKDKVTNNDTFTAILNL